MTIDQFLYMLGDGMASVPGWILLVPVVAVVGALILLITDY